MAFQGNPVSISADGNTVILGGNNDNGGVGAAWIFTRSAGVWTQQGAKLVGTGWTTAARQGSGVALSGDGNTALVGGNSDNASAGAAWVFTRSAGVWSQQGARLTGSDVVGAAYMGACAALSANGNTAIVGGYGDNASTGAAWVFTRDRAGAWSQQGSKLVEQTTPALEWFGYSVALSADGNTAVSGGIYDLGGSGAGAAWVFVNPCPRIAAIGDVPNDQGGKVNLRWTASMLDYTPGNTVDAYWIWRQVPIRAAQQALAAGAMLVRGATAGALPAGRVFRTTTQSAQTYYWEYVASQPSHGFPAYSYTATTLADSVPGSNPYTLFMVEAEQTMLGQYWDSDPDSGYSVDNLPPGPPAPIAAVYQAGATNLHWAPSVEPDFAMYRLYRGTSAGFAPGPGNLVATKPDTGLADPGPAGGYYKLSAVDVHGNEGAFTLFAPGTTAGVGDTGPLAFALERLHNPSAGGRVTVSFSLPDLSPATLDVVDASGRRVAGREVGTLGAGRHTLALGAERRLSPGIYFVRLSQAGHIATARVAVLD